MVYLVRHAEYDNTRNILPGRLPVELNENGKKQAEKLSDYFKDKNISTIYSSAVLRCKQTAEIIANGKIPIVFDRRLLEVLNAYQGYWVPDTSLYYTMRETLGGETNLDVQKRMIDFWNTIGFEENKNYVICAHGDPIYFLKQYLLQEKLIPELQDGGTTNFPQPYLPMAGVWPVEKNNEKWEMKEIINIEKI